MGLVGWVGIGCGSGICRMVWICLGEVNWEEWAASVWSGGFGRMNVQSSQLIREQVGK